MFFQAKNQLKKVESGSVQSADGIKHIIVIALDIPRPAKAAAFIEEVVGTFKNQRMLSAPETSLLLVTLVSKLSTAEFAAHWQRITQADTVAKHFMSLMEKADVIREIAAGSTETSSLLVQ